jgi:hypothetical protein
MLLVQGLAKLAVASFALAGCSATDPMPTPTSPYGPRVQDAPVIAGPSEAAYPGACTSDTECTGGPAGMCARDKRCYGGAPAEVLGTCATSSDCASGYECRPGNSCVYATSDSKDMQS